MSSPHANPTPPFSAFCRRKDLRLQILGQLYGHVVALDVPLAVQNLSAGGFAVESPIPFHAGASHRFRFTLDGGRLVQVDARAVHTMRVGTASDEGRYFVGFEFARDTDDPQADASIDALLEVALAPLTVQ